MKKYSIVLAICLYLEPSIGFGYTPPATWDPTGSNTETLHTGDYTCAQLKGMLGESYQAMYRIKGCKKNLKVDKPQINPYKPYKQDFTNNKQNYNPNPYWKQQEIQKKIEWSRQMSHWIIHSWLYIYSTGQKLSGYLNPNIMNDIYYNGYMYHDQLNQCLSQKVYNDFNNISNMVNANKQRRLLHWTAGMLRDCHRQIKNYY